MIGRAVVVSPDPTGRAGGTERFCIQLADLLRRLGFDVAVVGPPSPPEWLRVHGGSALWQGRALRRLAQRLEPDLVVTSNHLGWPGSWGGLRIQVLHGNVARQARAQGGSWHWRLRWGLDRGLAEAVSGLGAYVVADSAQAAGDARRLYRARVDAVVPLGVDPEVFHPRDGAQARRRLGLQAEDRYGLFVGRGEPGKGPGVALEACRRAGFTLLAAGPRPVGGSIPLGVLGDVDLAWAYSAADAVVLPTRYEGFGYVAAEALACRVPVVTTPTGWVRELPRAVPAYRPWLVTPDVESVTGALSLVGSAEARAATGAARDHVLAHYTRADFERRWIDLLSSLGAVPVAA